jgi:hypothetical protein
MRAFVIVVLLSVGGSYFSPQTLAAQPLRTVYQKDIDGDGRADKLVYEIRKWKDDYEGSLVITSATRRTL